MAEMVKASDVDIFFQAPHGLFALPTIQYLKPTQEQQYLDKIRNLTFHSKLAGRKLENIGNN